MPLPATVAALIETFRNNEADYLRPDFKEARLRQQFLDPLFTALGWDIYNTLGYSETYKEVILEDTIHTNTETKSVDYTFRIGDRRIFIAEAKKPSVSIKDDPAPAFQLRRYLWMLKLPLGIVSNFREIAIYANLGRARFIDNDKASVARILHCRYDELAEKWDEIAGIFSKEAVLKGAFDKFAASAKSRRGTEEFDDAFLRDMEKWRDLLARNIALRNPALGTRELNFSVQRIIDRIVFLRMAEARGIEPYGQLQALLPAATTGGGAVEEEPADYGVGTSLATPNPAEKNLGAPRLETTLAEDPGAYGGGGAAPRRQTIYPRLCEIFQRADYRYNSGIFHFENDNDRNEAPDKLTLGLSVDDAVLRQIIKTLYNKDYAFRYMEAPILGSIYERFLGKTIRLTEGHRAVVDEKPEVRKAGGVYYTPAYIVDYIVRQTLDPLLENKTPAQVAKLKILDPACGSGNFLYVTLEHMKRLEGEVIAFLRDLGETETYLALQTFTVDPHQFLGIEVNSRAAAIAELVLWIGYLQWHFRVHGDTMPAEPVLKKFNNIENRDAVLAYDKKEDVTPAIAEANPKLPGLPADWRDRIAPHTKHIVVWNRKTTKTDSGTGREIPDPAATVPLFRYTNPRPADWPEAEYIVGNPPFIGASRMRDDLGDGYVETLRAAYPEIPESADFVMYWWHKAAEILATPRTKLCRFGFITTNSIRQTFSRRVLQRALEKDIHLAYAIPDHPWVDSADGADVRISMTVAAPSAFQPTPRLQTVLTETPAAYGEYEVTLKTEDGRIHANLTSGCADATKTKPLRSNEALSSPGVKLHGSGFIITPEKAVTLGLGKIKSLSNHIRPYRNGKDITDRPRKVMVIDLFGLTLAQVRESYNKVHQHVSSTVKPERDQNNRESYRKNWWIHGEPRRDLRPALSGLSRYIVTVETSKHRFFQFLKARVLPDNMLVVIASDDAFHLGVLSSRIHAVYALAAGGRLGVGNDPRYNKTRCFDPFPFPACTEIQKNRIRALAEEIDAHRKRAQQKHKATLTDIYNLLEKFRSGQPLTDADRRLNDTAYVIILRDLHDELDAAVADAYGWSVRLTDDEILVRLVDLNARRAAEESEGKIRWLRPDYQIPLLAPEQTQATLALGDTTGAAGNAKFPLGGRRKAPPQTPASGKPRTAKPTWTKDTARQFEAIETVLDAADHPMTAAEIAAQIARAKPADVQPILDTLETLARIHPGDQKGTYLK